MSKHNIVMQIKNKYQFHSISISSNFKQFQAIQYITENIKEFGRVLVNDEEIP